MLRVTQLSKYSGLAKTYSLHQKDFFKVVRRWNLSVDYYFLVSFRWARHLAQITVTCVMSIWRARYALLTVWSTRAKRLYLFSSSGNMPNIDLALLVANLTLKVSAPSKIPGIPPPLGTPYDFSIVQVLVICKESIILMVYGKWLSTVYQFFYM